MAPPYFVMVRSAITAVTTPMRALCEKGRTCPALVRGNSLTAVERPHVGVPKLLVFGRPRKATAMASPELATPMSVSTATRAFVADNLCGEIGRAHV